ncbi:MAG: TIGR02301 family protein [Methylocystis sp.]
MKRAVASSPRRRPIIGAAALIAALTCSPPAPAANFLEGLFGGDESSAQTARPRLRGVEPRPSREPPAIRPPAQSHGETQAPKRAGKAANKYAAKSPAKSAAKPPAEPSEPPPPPYEAQIQRLAEVLGGLSFLRDLCGEGDGDEWRGKMAQLRDADAAAGPRRQRLAAAFNRGFRAYELTYRVCTPNARLVVARYLEEAKILSHEVASRYGNP